MRSPRLFLFLAALLPISAQAQSPAEMPGHIQLRVPPPINSTVDATPHIVANTAVPPAIAARLNTSLDALDTYARKQVKDCADNVSDPKLGYEFDRGVEVTMRGPRWLSMTIDISYTCGGPHPDMDSLAVVLDTTTGKSIDWPALLPGARITHNTDTPELPYPNVIWPTLGRLMLAGASSECRQAVGGSGMSMTVWLDGDHGTLSAEPSFIPHALLAECGMGVSLNVARLRALGVKPALLDALTTAMRDPSPLAIQRRAKTP